MIVNAKIRGLIDSVLSTLCDYGRMTETEMTDFQKNFDDSNLVIGVVGKIKAGKSSLVNAAIFGDAILPSGSQPITVTLTEIAYGETNSAVVELLTKSDIEELKQIASMDECEGQNKNLILNAKETLSHIPENYESMIAKKEITIPFGELADYVSTSGKLSGLAKIVHVRINSQALKGITIIDTPGFNDPITSRGETTKGCLSKCNVILFVHNQNGYDQVDAELLKNQIEFAGISELVDIYNKIDILHIPFSEWEEQLEYFNERRDEYIKKFDDNSNITSILLNSQSVMVSSLMALCGQIPTNKQSKFQITSTSEFEEEYNELTDLPEGETLSSKLVELSNISGVTAQINRVAEQGSSYLLEAPLLTLKGKLESIVNIVKDEIEVVKSEIADLSSTVTAAEKEKDEIKKFFDQLKEDVKNNQLYTILNSEIVKTFNKLCSSRESYAKQKFTEENYPDPSLLQRGVTKHNLGNYNCDVADFENELRNEEYALQDVVRSRTDEYINSICLALVSTHVDDNKRERIKKSLTKSMNMIIDEVSILIDKHAIKSLPDGNLNQWALLQNNFLCDFKDRYFESELSKFQERAKVLSDPDQIIPTLTQLFREIINSLSATPEQKERERKQKEEELNSLNAELLNLNSLLKQIVDVHN